MADQEFISSLVAFGKQSALNAQILQNAFNALVPQILSGRGQQVTSFAIPGQTIAYASAMSLQEQSAALSQALAILNNAPLIIRRTTARYF